MRSTHFLLVDDDRQTLKWLERVFSGRDYEISLAGDGEEALRIVRKCRRSAAPVDVVITDVKMPGMDGVELLKKIKRYYPSIAVIVMTGFDEKDLVSDLFRDRCDNYIQKPLEPGRFLEVVDDTIAKFKDERARRRIITRIEERTNKLLGTDEFFDGFAKALFDELDIETGSIFLLSETEKTLILRAIKSGREGGPYVGLTQKLGQGIAGSVAQDGKPMLVISRNDFKQPVGATPRTYATESYLCLPVLLGEELVGVINFTQKKSREPFTEQNLHFLLPLATHFAGTLKQQQHQLELRQQAHELSIKITDATEQLHTREQQLLSARKFNMDVIDNIPLAIVVIDEKYVIKTANKIFCSDFARITDIEGRAFVELIREPEERRRWQEVFGHSFAEDGHAVENFVHHLDQHENRILNLRSTLTRLVSQPDERYLLLVIEDISQQVIMREKVEKSDRLSEIGQLAAGVAHEINNPLDGVLRFTNLSLSHAGDPDLIKKCLKESKSGLERISRIVKSLLTYSSNISNKTQITSINQLLDEILVLLTYLQLSKNIHIKSSFNPDLPDLATFENLDQVFTNIIKNAYEAMDDGGELEIVTDFTDGELIVKFRDTGCGVPKNILKNLGKPFHTTKDNGTGLGLSICREILEQHGGKFEVEQTSQSGTTFVIRIPRKVSEKT